MYGDFGYFGSAYDLGDLGAPKRRKAKPRRRDAGWSEKGIDARIRVMSDLTARLQRLSANAKKHGHTAHARVLDEMADLASKETARLRRRDASAEQTRELDGFGASYDLSATDDLGGIAEIAQKKVLGVPLWLLGLGGAAAFVYMRKGKGVRRNPRRSRRSRK